MGQFACFYVSVETARKTPKHLLNFIRPGEEGGSVIIIIILIKSNVIHNLKK